MLKILIESACESGSISQSDRKLIEQKAQQMGISIDKVNLMIDEEITKNQKNNDDGLESGFISIEDETKEVLPPPPPSSDNEKIIKSKFTDVKSLSVQGAMSDVSQAKLHGKWIIIKRIKSKFKDNPKYRELFIREFENSYHLDHPHIVRLLDKGEDSEGLYYTMEFVDGRPLSELIKEKGINNDKLSENIARQILDALSYVHKKQIFHRDLKPDNIIVTFRGDNVKILDFGLAAADNFDDDLLKVGTPRYAAPEQMDKELDVDQRADIYSFGKIFLEMLSGKVSNDSINDINNETYKYIIEKSIEKSSRDRFHDCDEIIRILNNPQSIPKKSTKKLKTDTDTTPIKPDKKPKKVPWVLIIVFVIVGGLIGLYFVFFNGKSNISDNDNKESELVAKADSLYRIGEYINAKGVYESIEEKNDYINSQIVTLNGAIDDYNKALVIFDGKNIARSVEIFKNIVEEYPDFVNAKEKLQECNEILKNVNFEDLQIDSESSTNKLGLLDNNGYVVVDFNFEYIAPISDWKNGLIPVKNNGKFGFIDKNLNLFAKCEYDGSINGSYVWLPSGYKVTKNGKTVVMSVDSEGNGVIK